MRLKQYLKENDLSFKDVADSLDVTPVCVRFWCENTRRPRPATISAIAKYTKGAVTDTDFPTLQQRRKAAERKVLKMGKSSKGGKGGKGGGKAKPVKKAVGRPRKAA